MKTILKLIAIAGLLSAIGLSAHAQGTAFTYQGRLINNGSPATGSYDFRFRLASDPLGNTYIGGTVLTNGLAVTNGLFLATLDFAGTFTGNTYWLEVDVRTNGAGGYTVLSPLQAVTPTPYAIFANTASNVSGTVSAAQISGAVASANLSGTYSSAIVLNNAGNTFNGSFTGNGASVTNLNANNLTAGTVPLAQLSGITGNQLDAATWQLATNLNGGNAALATNVVSGIAITNAFITNSVFAGNGSGLTNLNAAKMTGTFTGNVIGPASTATNFSGSLAGDVTGAQGATTVGKIQGTALAATVPSAGQVLRYNGTTWAPATDVISLTGNGDITVSAASGAVTLGDTATNANTPNTIVKRDATGSFSATNLTLGGSLYLPVPTNGVGIIYAGGSPFIYALYPTNTYSFFAGPGAGNLTMGGSQNTGIGYEALYKNTSGFNNTGIGYNVLGNNTSGAENTAVGANALAQNFSGSWNIALGMNAGMNITTGSSNIDIGNNVGQTSDNNIIRIGSGQAQTYIAGQINGNGAGLTNVTAASLSIPPGMALIPAGAFTMGNSIGDSDITDANPTNVTVSAFYMDVNLMSYSQWKSVYYWATNHGYGFVNGGAGKAANHPVQMVDWYDCVKWCNARSQQAGKTPVYYTDAGFTQVYTNGETDAVYANWTAKGYRLPTEAEWEKAARGGLSGQRFPWGNVIDESLANYYGATASYTYDLGPNGYNPAFTNGVAPYTSPAGYFASNGYGLYDMAGNVMAWCWDWYGTPYGQPTTNNPTGANSGSRRVDRGGSYSYGAFGCRAAFRGNSLPANGDNYRIGFRSVLSPGQ